MVYLEGESQVTVYVVRMKSDHSLCSIWSSIELARAARMLYKHKWGDSKYTTYIIEVEGNTLNPTQEEVE